MKYFLLGLALLLCGRSSLSAKLTPVAPAPLELLKPESDGVFQDAKGGSHPWSIGQAHFLRWDGLPYLPVGAAFQPQSWARDASEAAWAKDKAALDMLGKRGVHDVVLSAGATGLTHVSLAAVQQVLDYLDANHFQYGLEIADFPQNPLTGYIVKPAVYRNPLPSASGPTTFRHIPGLAGAFYMLVSPRDGEIEESGTARVLDAETAQVTLKTPATDDVLLLYPQRLYFMGTPESRLPDLWEGYDEYRDRLLGFFSHLRLGPGFRFFLDPFTRQLGFGGEVENVIPTTDGFRLDFEAWLDKKYHHNVDDLNRGWGIRDHDLPDFAAAARSLPLWSGSKGVPAVYDPVKKVAYAVLNKPRIGGHVWDDLQQFRIASLRGYMNSMADVLKKGVADVPVVYGWGGRSALFTNTQSRGGFDGLSIGGAAGSGAYAFAQAEETPKTTWLIAGDALGDSGFAPTGMGEWDALKDLGTRGFFAPVATSADAGRLAEYGAALSLDAPSMTELTRVLPYPAGVSGVEASVRRLSDGVWWLPSYRAGELFQPGDAFSLGPLLRGYRLNDPDGLSPRFVVWSPHGAMTQAQFPFPKDSPAVITDAAGIPLKVEKKKNAWTVPLGADPIVFSHVASVPLPVDAAEAASKEAKRLLKLAKDQGLATALYQEQLFHIDTSIPTTAQDADLRYNAFARLVGALTNALQPYLWLEGESANSDTFDSLVSDSEASGGSYLALDTGRLPPSSTGDAEGGYRADYKFYVNATGSYALWAATSPLRDSSPFTYTLDDGGANTIEDAESEGGLYAGKFVWSHLGDATLGRGPHTLTLAVTGPRPHDKRYLLAVDAFCLSRVAFHPNGTTLPAIELLPPIDDKGGKRKK